MHWLEIVTAVNFIALFIVFVLCLTKIAQLPTDSNHPINLAFMLWIALSLFNWIVFAIWAVVR